MFNKTVFRLFSFPPQKNHPCRPPFSYLISHSSMLRVSKIPGNPQMADKAKVENMTHERRVNGLLSCVLCNPTDVFLISICKNSFSVLLQDKKIKTRSKRDGCDHPPLALYFHLRHPHWRYSVSEKFVYSSP